MITKEPSANLHAHPLEDNILEWHFVITGSQEPYTDGKYHGYWSIFLKFWRDNILFSSLSSIAEYLHSFYFSLLEFPPSYPMAPPAIRMLTPSGRFEVSNIFYRLFYELGSHQAFCVRLTRPFACQCPISMPVSLIICVLQTVPVFLLYRIELWNPAWTVQTILIGLQSFMYYFHLERGFKPEVSCFRFIHPSSRVGTKKAIRLAAWSRALVIL